MSFDFAKSPQIQGHIPRSKFNMPHSIKFTGNVGDLIPFEVTEVLPGDNITRTTNSLTRLQTLITPIMDDLYEDTYYFFVPNRLVWDHWQEFCGENKNSAWTPTTTYSVPQMDCAFENKEHYIGSIADYMGIPYVQDGITVNALPFRAYGLIWNEWFRDESLQDPVLVPTDDSTYKVTNGVGYCGKPFKSAKYHDYFTSCLPEPQRGPDVSIPLTSGDLPVVGNGLGLGLTNGLQYGSLMISDQTTNPFIANIGSPENTGLGLPVDGNIIGGYGFGKTKVTVGVPTSTQLGNNLENSGLVAMIGEGVPVATINTLRMAFATQQLYEIDSNGGRYTSILRNHFGVISPDARLQRPELLSYNHKALNITQVVQSSESGTTPQGTTTAYSVTGDTDFSFSKSFVEHGYLIGLKTVRYNNTYQQGLHKMWSRLNRFDYYWPVFANLGNQPVLNKEIYAQGNAQDDEVFGYQEAWADYRYTPNRVSAELRSVAPQSLDYWHLADDYSSLPKLSPDWIVTDKNNVNRVIAVSDELSNQLLFDIALDDTLIRAMPTHSVPGLYRM